MLPAHLVFFWSCFGLAFGLALAGFGGTQAGGLCSGESQTRQRKAAKQRKRWAERGKPSKTKVNKKRPTDLKDTMQPGLV